MDNWYDELTQIEVEFALACGEGGGGDMTIKKDVEMLKNKTQTYSSNEFISNHQRIDYPKFKKLISGPIFRKSDTTWMHPDEKIYFPSMIEVKSILGDKALDNFYMYYSPDHTAGRGGIGLATASKPEGPWTDRGLVFVDLTPNTTQTETPDVIWNERTKKFHLYYHQVFTPSIYRDQATCVALSGDGVKFEIYKEGYPLIKIPENQFPGDGHTGYARIYRMGDLWVMRHLQGGTDYSHQGLSYSKDGLNWVTDPRPVVGNAEWSTDGTRRKTGVNDVFRWRGEYWTNVNDTAWTSGPDSAPSIVYVSPYKGPRFPGEMLYESIKLGESGSWDDKSIRNVTVFEWDDKLYMLYEGINSLGENAFGLAVGEV